MLILLYQIKVKPMFRHHSSASILFNYDLVNISDEYFKIYLHNT